MSDARALAGALAHPGEWTFVYTDGHGDEPVPTEEERRRSVRDRLTDAGAPAQDVEAVDGALRTGGGIPSPSTRYLLVRRGEIVVDEQLTGARIGSEQLGHGPLPAVLPLLRHQSRDVSYLVVETGREGARIRSERAGRRSEATHTEVEGRTDSLPKVQAGGWSQRRYQMHTQEIWKQNQGEVAEVVDRLVREERPRFVVVTGDVRARGLLTDALAPAARELVVEVEAHTKADGADDAALDEAIARTVQHQQNSDIAAAQDRAASDDGARRAEGVDAVVDALQQARVDALVLDAAFLDTDEQLTALDAEPWVAQSAMPGASPIGEFSAAEALARAALLTDARVLVLDTEPAPGQPRPARPTVPPVALLRWAD